ncbi:DUF4271 domain-containing protein [Cytophaga hutchinsonii]|uniref:DUF4271 domain-containing protein n=1 Tax=Cytophaga hutchinsonii (strain ATCC 33406 / DSM 1761 / CIP 103989 / NBRC 15051 / NCIMB 9469 / D465) TaxID=269798 RepID=A0A6N4SMI8_CYTH3|nr:DUF4271 domain-containing protein [Cytophaga hutchinsonii]ABG57460.1 conserved hypothetical protein, alkaline phosphatase superfamily [Cytophaga hutchinsonii ATCC 33406]SFW98053.1 protein of unknown function [Cytophaga hutchinsonii ATCC 33406]
MYKQLIIITKSALLIFLLSICNVLYGNNYYTVKDLSNDWQVYDKYYQSYIPLLVKGAKIQSGGIYINKNSKENNFVSFYSSKGLSIFIENKLVYKHPQNAHSKRVRLPLADLQHVADNNPYLILFYNSNSSLYVDSVRLEVLLPADYVKKENIDIIEKTVLRKSIFDREIFIITVLIFCVVLILYKFIFMKGRSLINIGIDRNIELLLLDRSGMMSVMLIIINALLYMIIYYVMMTEYAMYFNFPFRFLFQKDPGMYMLYIFSAFVFMQTVKIVYIKIINELTFPSGVSPLQNYLLLNYLFQIGLLIFPILLFVTALFPVSYMIFIAGISSNIFFLILVIISLLTSYMIYSRSELRNIYLFSYICTAEIVPLIIAYRVLLG